MRIRLIAVAFLATLALPPLAARAQYVNTANGLIPQIGATPGAVVVGASTNCSSIKASAGILFKLSAMASGIATTNFVRMYNTAGTPAPSTDTPVMILAIPGSGAPLPNSIPSTGEAFATGIGICVTGTGAATSNTAAAGSAVVNYSYK